MAAEVLSNIASALATTFQPEITRTWNRMAVAAQQIPIKSGGGQGGGKQVAWDVEMDGAGAGAFGEGSDIGAGEYDFDPVQPAVLPWGQYRAAFQISNLELNAAAENIANAAALEDIFAERVLGKAAKLLSQVNKDLYSGTGTSVGGANPGSPNIVGLDNAILLSGTYATIPIATYATWAGTVAANGGIVRSLSLALLASVEASLFTASGFSPDFLLSDPVLHAKYEGLFETIRRTMDDGSRDIPAYRGSTNQLFWRGRPLVRDKDATATRMYLLNRDEIALRVLPFRGAPDGVPVQQRELESSNGKDSMGTGIPVHIYPLGRTGSGVKFVVELYCQLQVRRPSAHAILADISEV